jgi:hypothetical protein
MRQLSANIKALIDAENVTAFYMVLVQAFDSGFVYFNTTSHYADLTLSNGVEYLSDGKLKSCDPPQLSATVDREQYKLILADPGFDDGATIGMGLVGAVLEVRLGFINPSTGTPYTNISDTFVVYKDV